ncbi:MAG: hypothetical protein ASARMPRED_000691 [Alectoria sarmentosa]|nr:MAG: hypothetical protein ASARMPRED_000691 [Alectoria sarmentosa]
MNHLNRARIVDNVLAPDPPILETSALDILSPQCILETQGRFPPFPTNGERRRAVGDHGGAKAAALVVLVARLGVAQAFELVDDGGDVAGRGAAGGGVADDAAGGDGGHADCECG